MAEKIKVEDLVKPLEALMAEKEAVERRIQDAISTLNASLNKLGFQVVPLEARARQIRRRRARPAKAEAKPASRRGRRPRRKVEEIRAISG